jgi:inosine-uridine nucleoside N-ribohydrolase
MDLILDTDVGSDCDDMMALAYLVYARRSLGVRIKAVTYCNGCEDGVPAIRAFFRTLNEAVPPIGWGGRDGRAYDRYCRAICERFGTDADRGEIPDAVSVLRRALRESEGAVLCAIGPFTNLAALLESKGDAISPLCGRELLKRSCKEVILMGGTFVSGAESAPPEWNARLDAAATRRFVEDCPVPIAFLPFEAGKDLLTGKPVMERYGESTPLSLSFCRFPGVRTAGGRHSWDPAAVLYACEGYGSYFCEALRGTVSVDEEGRTRMHPFEEGMHTVIGIGTKDGEIESDRKAAIAAYIDSCAMRVIRESAAISSAISKKETQRHGTEQATH